MGLSGNQIAANVRRGWLRSLHRGVYAVGHRPLSWRARWMAAVLACGPGAALSHFAAAVLWQLGLRPRTPIDVTVPASTGRRSRSGVALHRSRSFEVRTHHAIPVTTPARTLLDIAPLVSRRALERVVDEAERLRLCGLLELEAILHTDRCRPGAVALAAVVHEYSIGSTLTRSTLEEHFLTLCREHGLPRPLVNEKVLDYRADFMWPDAGVIVEVDGGQSHGTRAAFQRDRTRDARLTAAGYRCLRFTYGDVTTRAAVVANRVRSLMRLGLADPGAPCLRAPE